MKSFGAGLALGVVATFLVAVGVWLTVVYTGTYNVAATDRHADAIRWTLDTTMRRSVARRAEAADMPEVSDDLVAEGAGHYASYCAHCHGAPGAEPAEWSRGMRPEPPHLVEAAAEWTQGEIHWIVSNGIKMSGMPAFADHGAEELAAITAFVDALPGLTADDYQALTTGAAGPGEPPAGAAAD